MTLVDDLLDLYDSHIWDREKVKENQTEFESIKKQLEENEKIVEKLRKYTSDLEANLSTTLDPESGKKSKEIYKKFHDIYEPILDEFESILGEK